MGRCFPLAFLVPLLLVLSQSPARAGDFYAATSPRAGRACGETLASASTEVPPSLTPALLDLGRAYPELRADFERTHQCVAGEEGCEEMPTLRGGEGVAAAPAALDLNDPDDQEKLMAMTKKEEPLAGRDYLAVVTQTGWLRPPPSYYLLYGVSNHQRFHLHAGGIDEVNAKALAKERAAQARLLEIFGEIEGKLEPKDKDSREALEFYRTEATTNEKNLGLLVCELNRMTDRNYTVEQRMGALPIAPVPTSSVTGEAPKGEGPTDGGGISADPPLSGASRAPADQAGDDILGSVEAYRVPRESRAEPAELGFYGESLFVRVKRKHRELDERGGFQRGLWEDAAPAQFP